MREMITPTNIPSGTHRIGERLKYYSQFASPALTKDILEKKISAKQDPRWQEFGFLSLDDYEFWSWRACGIICLKMIVDSINHKSYSVRELVEEGIKLGAYIPFDNHGNLIDKGWYYKPLIELARKYSLDGEVFPQLSHKGICEEILKKHFFIASVNPEIIRYDKTEGNKGGHLVVVHGFVWDGNCKGFYIHNPSGKHEETRANAFIPIETFLAAYSNRGFSLWPTD